jgi:ring-1,2-phenylacetyl-CoA epoxidase subunit PaaC
MAAAAPDPRVEHLLRLGDGCLVLSHRLSEWIGRAPALEEELAIANVGLDLLGQARNWLSLAGEVEGRGRDENALAYLRDVGGFRNALLVEQPNGDFAATTARQYFFDVWHHLALQGLARAADARVAEIAAKSLKEVTYHLRRSEDWVVRLGDGTAESRRRMQAGVDEMWPFVGELFEMDAVEQAALDAGAGVDLAALREPWLARVEGALAEATLAVPTTKWHQRGGKRGVHTEHLGRMLAEMQFLQRAYPGAAW